MAAGTAVLISGWFRLAALAPSRAIERSRGKSSGAVLLTPRRARSLKPPGRPAGLKEPAALETVVVEGEPVSQGTSHVANATRSPREALSATLRTIAASAL
jgi:hypothetical protein